MRIRLTPAKTALAIVATYLVTFAMVAAARMLLRNHPTNAFESVQITEAWRAAHGLAVYTPLATGHATHMYGPLWSYVLALPIALFGINITVLRIVSLACALGVFALLLRCASARGWTIVAGIALFAAADLMSKSFSTLVRPDMIGLLLAVAGVVWCYRRNYILGSIAIVIATLIKQPLAMAALIPIAPLWLQDRRRIAAFAPLLAVLATLLFIRLALPSAWFYMMTEPSRFGFSAKWAIPNARVLAIATLPLLATLRRDRDARTLWFASAVVVTVPLSLYTALKIGGDTNSLLPAILAMHTCALWLLRDGRMNAWLQLALLLQQPFAYRVAGYNYEWDDYPQIVAAVQALPSDRVLAPEDPVIILRAKHNATRSVYAEMEARPLHGDVVREVPCVIRRDMAQADYVVDVGSGWAYPAFGPDDLRAAGYHAIKAFENYTIWQRTGPVQPFHCPGPDVSVTHALPHDRPGLGTAGR